MKMRRLLLTLAATFGVLALAGVGAAWFALQAYDAPGPLAERRAVVVPRGSPAEVADALVAAGVVQEKFPFMVAAALTSAQGHLRAAEFAFPAHGSLREVLAVLRTARPVQHRLTIPEGLTAAQIAKLLDGAEALIGDTPLPPEGSVLPETYAFERGATRQSVIARATEAMQKALAQAWAGRADGVRLSGPDQMLTLASIVERETARPEERPLVARVFLNRLQAGMRLQSDPTVIYAVSGGQGVLDRKLTRADLEHASPYNTYVAPGLPPGPIASPGLAALAAVARPADSDALYFVADGSGGHAFARTLEEHQRNVARWRAGEAARAAP